MSLWDLKNHGTDSKPILLESIEIQDRIVSGLISIHDEIRKEGEIPWKTLQDYPEFDETFASKSTINQEDDDNIDMNALIDVAGGRIMPVPGGVLIRDAENNLLGAVGISGDVSDQDERCAIAGIEAVGFFAVV